MFGSEPIVDGQHAGACRRRDAPGEVAVKSGRADDETTTVQKQNMATTFREPGANAVRPDPAGIDRERLCACRWLRDQARGGRRVPPLLLDRHIVAAVAL